jgi:hypothetical protein
LSKTGTHSLAGLFDDYRAVHHPDAELRLDLAIRLLSNQIDVREIERVLGKRDRFMWLEMESSTLSGILIEPLLKACPEKKYILTIRDVYSWAESWMDHTINKPPRPQSGFAALDRIRLRGEEFPHTPNDAPLAARGLASLASYFSLWADHNRSVLAAVPPDRLLIVRTSEILDRIPEIAAFAGVSPGSLRPDLGWQFAAPKKHHMLSKLDASYVGGTAKDRCGDLMEQFFPDDTGWR